MQIIDDTASGALSTASPLRATVTRLDLWTDPIFERVLGEQPGITLQVLPAQGDPQATLAGLRQSHAYHVSAAKDELPRPWFVSAELIAQCPQLLVVSSSGAGYDTIDAAACTAAGIAVVNQAGGNAESVAEQTFALLLAVKRRVVESHQALQQGRADSRESLMGREIHGLVLGLVGIGQIGKRVARIARGFGLTVLAHDPQLDDAAVRALGAEPVTLSELLARSDVVSLHCPLDAGTRNLIDASAFAAMKPGAVFISTARGGIHDESALLAALESGHLAGAGLDVWVQEPPAASHPLLALPNVVASFHTGGVTHEGRRNVARSSAEQILAVLRGQRPPQLRNPEVWPRVLERLRAHAT